MKTRSAVHATLLGAMLSFLTLPAGADSEAVSRPRLLGIELGLGPLVGGSMGGSIHLCWPAWRYGDLCAGPFFRYQSMTSGTFVAYTVSVDYRQLLWKGLHLDLEHFPTVGTFASSVDGRNYRSFKGWTEIRLGYKFSARIGRADVYLIPQVGAGFSAYWFNNLPEYYFDESKYANLQVIGGLFVGLDWPRLASDGSKPPPGP